MLALVLPLLGGAWLGLGAIAQAQSTVTTIVTDPLTGLAIGGMDPVSYFTETSPQLGNADHELIWSGVSWQFASAANLEVFKRSPQIYAPQYGGHGAMGVARGFVSDSDPYIYTVFKQRLYLFYSAGNREAFLLAPDRAAVEGRDRWLTLSKTRSSQ